MLRTKEQEKTICGDCPIAKTANLIGDTFALLIIRDLLTGPKRFGDIEQSLSGVSSRTVVKKLDFLEQKKLITRKENASRVEYALTKNGQALEGVMKTMGSYGKKFL